MLAPTKFTVLCSLCLVFSSIQNSASLPTPYQFAYRVDTTEGSHGHAEYSDGNGRVEGFYVINLGDGRLRTVRYYADETGFHPTIESNEPGVVSSAPANAPYTVTTADDRSRPSFTPAQALAPLPIPRNSVPAPNPIRARVPAAIALAPEEPARAAPPAPVVKLVTVAAPAPAPETVHVAVPAPLPSLAPVAAPAPLSDLISVPAQTADISPVSVSAAPPTTVSATAAVEERASVQAQSDATIPAAGSAIEKTVVDVKGDDVLSDAPAVSTSSAAPNES